MATSFFPATTRFATPARAKARKLKQALGASIALAVTAFAGCASKPLVPEAKNVRITREEPRSDCREIGSVQGSVATARGTVEEAIQDMRLDAARKGANFVRMQATSAIGTSVSGTAYDCP
jgi:hypothetical protein